MRPKKQAGYTLLEVLVYTFILATLLLLVSQVFISVKLTNAHATALMGLQRNLRQIVSDLNRTIKTADGVDSPLPGETTASLSLNSGGVVYQLNEGVLQKQAAGETWSLTTDEVTVSDLSFTNPVEATQSGAIRAQMTVESNYLLDAGRKLSEELITTISLR